MDGSRFDDITRALAGGVSRRGALKLLFGGAIAGVQAVAGRDAAAQAAQDAARKPPGFERLGKRCDNGQPCGIHVPCSNGLYCTPAKCWIEGQLVDNLDVNDDNPCQHCVANEHRGAWARWSSVRDGTTCPPGDSDNPCLSTFIGTCQNGECVAEPVADGTECGPGQSCCTGDCCAAGVPCNAETGCGGCQIDGANHPAGPSPNPCLTCDAVANPTGWTPTPGNPPCGDNLDRICCNGDCCPPGQCCSPAGLCEDCCDPANGEARREDGSCEPGCTIGDAFYEPYAINPANDCEECDISASTTAWTPKDFGGCGGERYRFCAGGVCCGLGICPDFATSTCGDYCSDVCVIGGVLSFNGDRNPANPCEQCASHTNHTAWTLVPPNYYCDPAAQTGACCDGTCCNSGEFCNTNEGFVCDANSGS